MSLDDTLFQINYHQMYDALYPQTDGIISKKDGIYKCDLTWAQAKARPGFLNWIHRSTKALDKVIWFKNEDPHSGSKPFVINWIGMEHLIETEESARVVLVVDGQKSERIVKKWTAILSKTVGYPVTILWEGDMK